MAMAVAEAGANVIIHFNNSSEDAIELSNQIRKLGQMAWLVQADISKNAELETLCKEAFSLAPVTALINNASIFEPATLLETSFVSWQEHHQVNLTAPFLLSQAFARKIGNNTSGSIVNMLDWRALRPGKDHFAYTITKAALSAMTESLALSLAPRITVNAIALGAILPPENEIVDPELLEKVPMKRWADLNDLHLLLIYLLQRPKSLTGQVINLDGGRHLVK
jgi:NAD(P)-dependent dehydrogenase (short-subunit alcohol dehydrogenase family)